MSLNVLYEDNHLIAVFKPAGVLVQADKTGDGTLMDEVKYYIKNKYHKTSQVFLGLVHRLDRPVAGVIIFGKTSKGAARLSEQFRAHTVEKIYHALVVGKPPKQKDTIVHFLTKNEKNNKVSVSSKPTPGSQAAELSYEVVKSEGANTVLRIILGTGRGHQIRSQLAAIGCPIAGDVKYGAPAALPDKSIALTATSLAFTTATGDERKTIAIPNSF